MGAFLHDESQDSAEAGGDSVSKIKVVEIAPLTVETALHRERKDPDDNKKEHGNKGALSVEEFMEQNVEAWKEDEDICTAGMGRRLLASGMGHLERHTRRQEDEFEQRFQWSRDQRINRISFTLMRRTRRIIMCFSARNMGLRHWADRDDPRKDWQHIYKTYNPTLTR